MNIRTYDLLLALVFVTLIILLLLIFTILLLLKYRKKRNYHLLEKQQLQSDFQHELLRSQLEIQEQTLKNISQEIHDNIGQVLTLAKLNLSTVPDFNSKELQEKISDSRDLISKAIQDLRDLSKSLNADFVIENGLMKSIQHELNLFKKIGGLQTNFAQEGLTYSLSTHKELILFRIFQEALNNIMKHAKASLVSVVVKFDPNLFRLEMTDNGVGFEIHNINNDDHEKPGLGIGNMKNRSHVIGATYSISSDPGKGTSIKITLPL